MAALKVKSFLINNINSADEDIATGIGVTSTVFSISVIPISAIKSRVIIFYN